MKNSKRKITNLRGLAIVVILIGVSAAVSFCPKKGFGAQDPAWAQKMQSLYRTLADVLTFTTSDSGLKTPLERAAFQRSANRLAELAHGLQKKGVHSPDKDPTLAIISQTLGSEAKRAAAAIQRGNVIYARSILRSIPSYCIGCHTRNDSGPQFPKLPLEPAQKSMTRLGRGEFYAASRQFDRALATFKEIIQWSAKEAVAPLTFERAVEYSLAIAVRVKKDPALAMEIVDGVLASPQAPFFLKANATAWKGSIQEWMQETPRTAPTNAGLHSEAVRLLARAKENQKYPMDRSADILFLRASATLHELLQSGSTEFDDVLLLTGISYEVLNPLRLEDLHEIYYETCVRRAPHTPTAQQCFERYEQSIFFGYTGSGGTEIPEDVKSHLIELQALSLPQKNRIN